MLYSSLWFYHNYGGAPMSMMSGIVTVWAVNLAVTFTMQSNSRQEYLVRIYTQHQRDMRIEQLSREKERLEYERAMAVAKQQQQQVHQVHQVHQVQVPQQGGTQQPLVPLTASASSGGSESREEQTPRSRPSATPQDTQRQGALPVLDAELMRKLEAAAHLLAQQGWPATFLGMFDEAYLL